MRNHAKELWTYDFTMQYTVAFTVAYVFVVIFKPPGRSGVGAKRVFHRPATFTAPVDGLRPSSVPSLPEVAVKGSTTKRRPRASAGTVLAGRYRLDEVLGRGGWATVYRARDLKGGEDVALKLLAPQLRTHAGSVKRFIEEARTLERLHHPRVVTVRDVGQSGRSVFIVLELLEARSLAEEIVREAPMVSARAVRIAVQILEGLGAAHDRGIIHRDLKPENVLLVKAGSEVSAKVADFGIARSVVGERSEATHGFAGTPAYTSPEQALEGEADARSDVFAVGLILYEMLAGEPAYPRESPLATLTTRATRPPAEIRLAFPDLDLPEGLNEAVMKLVAHAPEDRPQDAREAIRLLAPFGDVSQRDGDEVRPEGVFAPLQFSPRFVGRDDEVAVLMPLVERLGDFPHATVVTIEGPAGVGKSRLAARIAELACMTRGALRYDKTCSDRGPISELSEVLEDLLGTTTLDVSELRRRLAGVLGDEQSAKQLGRLVRAEADEEPDGERSTEEERRHYRCQLVLDALARLASRPLVIVLDDLHVGDSLTRAILQRVPLWAHDRGKGLLFIATKITDGEEAEPPRQASARVAERATTLRLGPLPESAWDALFEEIGPIERRARELIGKIAAGNPLHLVQLVRHMANEKLLLPTRRGWRLAPTHKDFSVPYPMNALAAQHVRRLRAREGAGELAADLLERLALVGERISYALLSDLLKREGRPDLLEKLDALIDLLVTEGLIESTNGGLVFCHRIVREAISSELAGRPGTSAMHIGIAEAILAQPDDDSRATRTAALHFFRGGVPKRSLPLALQSAKRARDLGDMTQASEDYALASRILGTKKRPSKAARLEVALGLGQTLLELGETRRAEDHFLQALDIEDCAEAHEGIGRTAELKGECSMALEHLLKAEKMYRSAGRTGEAAEVSLALLRASQKLGDLEAARGHAETARTLFESVGDDSGVARAMQWLGSLELFAGDYAKGLAFAEAAAPALEATGNPLVVGYCLNTLASLHAELGHHQVAIDLNHKAQKHFERAGRLHGITNALGSIGTAHGWLGNYEDGARLLEVSLRLAEDIEHQRGVIYALINLGWLCRLAGKLEESEQWLRSAIAQIHRAEDHFTLPYAYVELGQTLKQRGELDESEVCFRRALQMEGLRPDLRAIACVELGQALMERGELDEAEACFRRALEVQGLRPDLRAIVLSALENIARLRGARGNN